MMLEISVSGAIRIKEEIEEKVFHALSNVADGQGSLENVTVRISLPDIGGQTWENLNNG